MPRDLACSSLLLASFHNTSSSWTSLTHLDGPIELSPQAVIGPAGGSGVAFRGRMGKSRRQSDGRRGSYGPRASTPKTFPRQTTAVPRHGASAAAPPNQAKIWTAGTWAQVTAHPGPARRRALHPPRRLIPNLSTGWHARLPGTLARAWPAPSPAHYSAPSGVLHYPLRPSHWSAPATTDGSVEPHTHHRRPLHASALLAHEPHWGDNGAHCPGRLTA